MSPSIAVLAGGCFWCLEEPFRRLNGVINVVSGYMGGQVENPSYRQICSGTTGHAEVVKITFDPAHIDFRTLLEVFFELHDPTTLNQQGHDIGSQYRSAIFYADESQRQQAHACIAQLQNEGRFRNTIVTQLAPIQTFYRAEDHHQSYYQKNPHQPYCQLMIQPKLVKLAEKHRDLLKQDQS
ncbi:peptide-methionine (S)-S-oxide reductase MsrA [Thalassotalea aquiviva]|uniref:peptide-methionine (S)-S-oxide reductase MsrA n=1 Tax=Thalassotalea aquiviva TaxID=3242415 RepID=UPI00352A2B9A